MSAISGYLNSILNAVYGEQVRTAIVNAITQCYDDVSSPSLNTAAFSDAIEAAYADGFLDIQEKSTIAGMTNQKIIYRYTGNETGYVNGALYYYDGTKWTPIGSALQIASSAALMTDTGAIYKYTGSESGYYTNVLYYYNGSNWTPLSNPTINATVGEVYGAVYGYSEVEENSVSLWESGGYNNGVKDTSTTRIRLKDYLHPSVGHVTASSGQLLLYAFDHDGTYVGYWTGESYGTSPTTAVYRTDFDIPNDGYVHTLVMAQNDKSETITTDAAAYVTFSSGESSEGLIKQVNDLKDFVGYSVEGVTRYDYDDLLDSFSESSYNNNYIYCVDVVGDPLSDAFQSSSGQTVYNCKIPVASVYSLEYTLFKSTSNYGCAFIDSESNIVWAYSNATLDVGTKKTVDVPSNAEYFIFSVPPSLQNISQQVKVTLYGDSSVVPVNETDKLKALSMLKINYLPYASTLSSFKKRSLALCGIKTEIVDNKIPFPEGYLFEELGTDASNKLYFGSRLDNAVEVGTMTFNVRDYQFAVSPTDGRIIACHRTQRNAMYIWDGETTTTLFSSASTKPKAWLYNSGIDFIIDGDGNECCIFAEYDPNYASGYFYVWKGVYPYTSESDWSIVFSMAAASSATAGTITHFHQIRRDPWTNILYLTSGDSPNQLRWWYSTDYGDNWTLLTDNANNGWEEHVCRCINFIFTEEYIYWAVDHGTNHSLNRISRNASTGIIDISTRKKLADLPFAQATNTVCYVDRPNGLFMFERIDTGTEYQPYYGGTIKQLFYSFDCNALIEVGTIKLTNNSWGGHRGQCYTNYCTGQEPHPAMGYSTFTPCVFDIVGASSGLGTIYYEL